LKIVSRDSALGVVRLKGLGRESYHKIFLFRYVLPGKGGTHPLVYGILVA
jgi:hypothetical protein